MLAQLDTKIISSFLLYIDHAICSQSGYKNVVSNFYPTTSPYSGTYVYSSPYKPLCNDVSIAGANIMSGVWLNNNFVTVGQSGLASINHYKGAVYFTGAALPKGISISGSVAIKEISVKITDQTDWKLLFENQYVSNVNLTYQFPFATGLPLDSETCPIVFIRYKGQENKPFGFSRLDNQTIYLRTIVITDSEFQKIAVTSILKNLNYRTIPIALSVPMSTVGDMTGVNYDYTKLSFDPAFTPIVLSVKAIDVPQQGEYRDIIRNMAIVDFELSTICRS